MLIGFDLDDTITKTAETFCKYSKDLHGIEISPRMLTATSAKFEDTGLIDKDQVALIKKEYFKDRIFRSIPSHKGAVDTLKHLQFVQLFFITTRNDYSYAELKEDTAYWLSSHGIRNYKLFFTNDKATIIKNLKLDLFIEDNISEVLKIRQQSALPLIIPARPWNIGSGNSIPNTFMVENWAGILKEIYRYKS